MWDLVHAYDQMSERQRLAVGAVGCVLALVPSVGLVIWVVSLFVW